MVSHGGTVPHTASDRTAKYRVSVWTGERRRDLLIVGLRVLIVGLRVLIVGLRVLIVGADERKTA